MAAETRAPRADQWEKALPHLRVIAAAAAAAAAELGQTPAEIEDIASFAGDLISGAEFEIARAEEREAEEDRARAAYCRNRGIATCGSYWDDV